MNIYRCPKCRKITERDSNKKWILSVCSSTGERARLQIINQNKKDGSTTKEKTN